MKLHLPKSLRAALLACLSIVSPVAATFSTGTLIAGAITYSLLAPQAQADVYHWTGAYSTDSAYYGSNWADSDGTAPGNGSFQGQNANIMQFAAGTTGATPYVDYGNSTANSWGSFGGIQVVATATNNAFIPDGTRNVDWRASSEADATTIGGVSGATNFIINEDFSYGILKETEGVATLDDWESVTMHAGAYAKVATEKTLTMYINDLNNGEYGMTVTGGGTLALNITSAIDASGDWIVSGGSTLRLNDAASALLTTAGSTATLTLDAGTVIVADGSIISNQITVGAGGATIQTSTAATTLTLSGSLTYNTKAFGGLSVDGASLTLATGFSVDLGINVSNGSYNIITDLGNTNTSDLLTFLNSVRVSGITSGQTAEFAIDGTTIKLTISGAESKTVTSAANGDWHYTGTWGGEEFNDGDTVSIGANGGVTITVDGAVTTADLSITGSGDNTLQNPEGDTEYTIANLGTVLIDSTGLTTISVSMSTDDLEISAGTTLINGDAFDASDITISGGLTTFDTVLTTENLEISAGTTLINGTTFDAFDITISGGSTTFDTALKTSDLTITGGSVILDNYSITGTLDVTGGSLTFTQAVSDTNFSSLTLNKGVNLTFESGFDFDDSSLTLAAATSEDEAGTIILGADSSVESITRDGDNAILKVEKMASVDDVTLNIYGGALTNPSETEAVKVMLHDYTVSVGEGVTISDNAFIYINGGNMLVTGGGTYKVSALYCTVSTSSKAAETTIAANTTLEIVGQNDARANGYFPSFWFNPSANYDNSLKVYGTFITNSAIYASGDAGTITVYAGGTYQMNRGTIAATSAATNVLVDIQGGATLALGNQDDGDTTDYAGEVTITLNDGATLTGTGGEVTTYHSFIYEENATVNFLANTGDTLIVKGDVAADINAADEGTVSFTNVTFNDSIVNAGTMNLDGAVSFTATSAAITNTGTLSLGLDGTLTVGESQSLAVNGGTIDLSKTSQIINNGTMTVDTSVVFDITDVASTDWVLDTTTGLYKLQLISGNAVDLSSLDVTTNLTGIDTSLDSLQFNTDGSLSYAADLNTYYFTGGALTWVIDGEGFTNAAGTGVNYVDDKDVIFTTADATVTLGGAVEADSMTIRAAADGSGINVSLTGGESKLTCADIIILGESSLTLTDAALASGSLISAESSSTSSIIFSGKDVTVGEDTTQFDFGDYSALLKDYTGNVKLTAGSLTLGSAGDDAVNPTLGFNSLTTTAGTLTVNSALELDSMSLGVSNTEFNGSVVVEGAMNLIGTYDDAGNINNVFNGTVEAGTLTVQYGTNSFAETVTVDSMSLLNGVITFTGAVVSTGNIVIGDTTTTFGSTVNALGVSVANGTVVFGDAAADTVTIDSFTSTGGTTTFNGAVTSAGGLSTGVGTVVFNAGGNTFSSLTITSNSGTITLGQGATVGFATSTSSDLYQNNITWNFADSSTITFDAMVNIQGGSTWTINNTGSSSDDTSGFAFAGGLRLGTNGSAATFNLAADLTATVDSTFYISACDVNSTGDYSSKYVNLNISGTFISNADSISLLGSQNGNINVLEGGTLVLTNGLTSDRTADSYGTGAINLYVTGELQLGNQATSADYSSEMTVTLYDGATVTTDGVADTTTVAHQFVFDDSATVNFSAAEGDILSLTGAMSAATNTVNIKGTGTIQIAGEASVSALAVESGASLELTSTGSLTLGSSATSTGTITLSGGSLTLTGASLTNDLVVTADGGSLNAGSLSLDGSITYNTTTTGLNLAGITGDISLGDNFSLELVDFATNNSYVIFTGLGSDDLLASLESITAIDGTDVIWTYDNGTITLSKDTVGVLYFDATADDGAGAWEDADGVEGDWDTTSRLMVETTSEQLVTIGVNDVTPTTVKSLTLDGEGTVILEGTINASSINLDGGTLALSGDAAGLSGDITISNASDGITLSTGNMSITANAEDTATNGTITMDDGGSLTNASLSNAELNNIAMTVNDSMAFSDVSFNDTTAITVSGSAAALTLDSSAAGDMSLSKLNIANGASVTVNNGLALTSGGGSVTDAQGSWVDTTSFTLTLNDQSSLDSNARLCVLGGQTINIEGDGTYKVTGMTLSAYSGDASTLTIGSGATMEITGISTTSYTTSSVNLGGYANGANTINVNGTLIINAALTQNNGYSNITVSDTGVLQLNQGLTAYKANTTKSTITVNGGNLTLGNEEESAKDTLGVTIGDNSTIEAKDEVTNVYTTLTYSDNSTVNLKAGEDKQLVMNSAVSGTGITINAEGSVTLAAGATLNTLTSAEGANLTISGSETAASAVTTTNLNGAGAVTVGSDGSLAMDAADDFTGTLTLDGGTLSTGSLETAIVVAADSTLAGSNGSLMLNGSISYADGTISSLAIADGTTVSIDSEFTIDLSGVEIPEENGSYDIFTGLSSDISAAVALTGYDPDAYQITWDYEDGTLTMNVKSWGEGTWDSTTGYIMGSDIANTTVEIVTTDVAGATLYVSDESGTMTVGGLAISGTDALSIESVDGDSLSLAEAMSITGTAVTANADITAADGVDITDGGSLILGTGSLVATGLSLDATSSLKAGNITLTDGSITADADTVLAANSLTSATIAGLTVTVSGDASLSDSSIDNSTLDITAGTLTLTDGSSISSGTTLANTAALTAGDLTITGTSGGETSISFADGGSLSESALSGATLNSAAVTLTGDNVTWDNVTIGAASSLSASTAQTLTISNTLQLDGTLTAGSDVNLDFDSTASLGISTTLLSDTTAALTVGDITSDSNTLAIAINATDLGSYGLADGDSYILISTTTALSEDWVYTLNGEASITVNGLIVSLEYDASNQLNLTVAALSGDTWDGNPGTAWSSSDNWVAGLTSDTNYLFTGLGLSNQVDVDMDVNADLIMVNITESEQTSYIFSSSTGSTLTTAALSITSGAATINMSFDVTGTATVESKGSLDVSENGSLTAGSLAVLGADTDGNAGSFTNAGTTNVSGAMTVAAGASASNSGTLTAGSLELAGSYSNTRTTTVNGALTLAAGSSLSNTGKLTAASLDTAISLSNAGTLTITGAMTVGDGLTVSNSGALSIGNGSNVASITMDAAGSTLTILEGESVGNSAIVTIGSLTGTGTLIAEAYTETTIDVWDSTVTVVADALAAVVINKINGTEDGSLEIAENGQVTINAGDEGVTFGEGYSSSGTLVVVGAASFEGNISEGGSVEADSLTVETGVFNVISVQYLELTSLTNVSNAKEYVLGAQSLTYGNTSGVSMMSTTTDLIELDLSALSATTAEGDYYLIENTGSGDGYSWSDFNLSTNTSTAISELVASGMNVLMTDTSNGDLVLTIAESKDRILNLSDNYAVDQSLVGDATNTITPIYTEVNGEYVLVSYDVLDSVDTVNIDQSATITVGDSTKGTDKDVLISDLNGANATYTLTLKGDGTDADDTTMTLSNDSTTAVSGKLVAQDVKLQVESVTDTTSAGSTTGLLTLVDLALNDSTLAVLDSSKLNVIDLAANGSAIDVAATGTLTAGTIDLDKTSTLTVADGGTLTVGSLTAADGSTISGNVSLGQGTSTLEGSFGTATINVGNGTLATIDMSDAQGLSVTGNAGSVNFTNAASSSLASVNTSGTSLDFGTISDPVTLLNASSINGGVLSFDLDSSYLGNTGSVLFDVAAEGEKLVLTNTTVNIGLDGSADLTSLGSANGSYTLCSLGDDVVMAEGSSIVLSSELAKYFAGASVSNGNVVATRNDSYYNTMGLTENGKAGLNLISKAFAATDLSDLVSSASTVATIASASTTTTATGDMADVISDLDTYMAAGATRSADTLAAAVAGATTTSLGSAMMADVERQLRTTRNRTRSMGVDPTVVNPDMPYYNAWIAAEGSSSKLDSDSTHAGHNLTNTGGAIGVDVDLNDAWSVGASFTALIGDLDSDGADTAKGDFDTMYASVYARANKGRWNHSFVASYGMLDASLDRTVRGTNTAYTSKGDTNGSAFGLMYEVGYTYAVTEDASTCIQPVFSMSMVNSNVDGYTEKGSDATLKVGDQKNTYVTFGVGGVIETIVGEDIYNRASVFSGRVMLKADAGERTSEADVTLTGNSGFTETVKGADVGALGVELGVGITIPVTEDVGAIFVDASCDLRSGMTSFSGTVGYRFSF